MPATGGEDGDGVGQLLIMKSCLNVLKSINACYKAIQL